MSEALHGEIRAALHAAQNILIVSHLRPDGDAIGSILGLGLTLQAAGKQVQMVSGDGVPMSFQHLAGSDQIHRKPKGVFDLSILVDCSDMARMGDVLSGQKLPDINIDHHATNTNFAKINLVDTQAVAVAEMLAEYLPEWGYSITPEAGAALLTGMITDTLGFRTHNITPQAMRTAASLMELGADMPVLYEQALHKRSFEALLFWKCGLNHLERNERMVWTTLTLNDRRAANYPGRDDADLINILSLVRDCDVAMIFVEQPECKVKVSWRARPGYDISQVAVSFGGGGHPAASGAEIYGTVEEVMVNVLDATYTLIQQQGT